MQAPKVAKRPLIRGFPPRRPSPPHHLRQSKGAATHLSGPCRPRATGVDYLDDFSCPRGRWQRFGRPLCR